MLDVHAVKSRDLKALSPAELTELASQMLAHIGEQTKHIDAQDKRIDSQARGIKWRDAKIESITFQLAKLKAWRFGAKTERMNAEQREIFEETFAADHASLEAQLAALQSSTARGSQHGSVRRPREKVLRRTLQGQRQPGRRPGDPPHRLAVPDRGRRQGAELAAAAADAPGAIQTPVGRAPSVAELERSRVPDGDAIAKAIDYSLNHWMGLGRFLRDGDVPIDNNHCENRIRPWALGRRNWLFIGSQLAGERAAVVMSLLQSAKLCGHEPWAYLKDILTRLPTQLNSRIEELLPHRWKPAG